VSLSDRDKRALRLGVMLAAPILILQFAIKPYGALLSRRTDEFTTQRGLLSRELQLLQQRAAYETHHVQARRLLAETESQLFLSPDEVSASAALTHYVTEHARRAVVQVRQIQTLPAVPLSEEVVAVEVEIRGESDFEGVLTFLQGLEFGDKLITIPVIRIESVAHDASDVEEPIVLAFTATMRGFSLPQTPERSKRSRAASHSGG
jgi:hypothetical protein